MSVVDHKKNKAFSFNGTAYVVLSSTPTGFESMYIGQDCDYDGNCGEKVVGYNAVAYFRRGVAVFQVSLRCFEKQLIDVVLPTEPPFPNSGIWIYSQDHRIFYFSSGVCLHIHVTIHG